MKIPYLLIILLVIINMISLSYESSFRTLKKNKKKIVKRYHSSQYGPYPSHSGNYYK
jgi:hypothetical protein